MKFLLGINVTKLYSFLSVTRQWPDRTRMNCGRSWDTTPCWLLLPAPPHCPGSPNLTLLGALCALGCMPQRSSGEPSSASWVWRLLMEVLKVRCESSALCSCNQNGALFTIFLPARTRHTHIYRCS